ILHSFDIGYASDVTFARAFRAELSKQSPEPINFFEVSVRPTPSAGDLQEEAVANYLRASLGGQRLHLVMTVSAPAALFARKYREQLFLIALELFSPTECLNFVRHCGYRVSTVLCKTL
ncbi:MAG TPA: hypothetical protein VFP16_01170, partial [Vicinamibacterales bacterium]|nr:hypothetical protein [Vicinamibacterales bacterium]